MRQVIDVFRQYEALLSRTETWLRYRYEEPRHDEAQRGFHDGDFQFFVELCESLFAVFCCSHDCLGSEDLEGRL